MKCICCCADKIIDEPSGLKSYYKCLSCGFVFTVATDQEHLREGLVHHYEKVDPHERIAESKKSFFRSVIDYISCQPGTMEKMILDVGCGFGYFLELAAAKGWQPFGVEIAHEAVLAARGKFGDENIFQGTLRQAQYPANFFDVITLWDVLVFVENPFTELEECFRVMKEGGILGIRVRNISFQMAAYRTYSFLKRIVSKLDIKPPYVFHKYSFGCKSIHRLIRRTGFNQIRVINSPLSKADPYEHCGSAQLAQAAKLAIEIISRSIFSLSRGKLVAGPSILVWAQKPYSLKA
jgi:2-polyprenyl-3-methyl-5-hydroxy-6-metoxy-1,4-benzoquinol methylase